MKIKKLLPELFPSKSEGEGPLDKVIADLKDGVSQLNMIVDALDQNKEKFKNPNAIADPDRREIDKEQIQYLKNALKFNIVNIGKVYKHFIKELDDARTAKDVQPKKEV